MGLLSLPLILIALQGIFIALFAVFVDYDLYAYPQKISMTQLGSLESSLSNLSANGTLEATRPVATQETKVVILKSYATEATNAIQKSYALFADVHAMVFLGLALLAAFLKRYGYSSISFTLLLGAFVVQWAILTNGWILNFHNSIIRINFRMLIEAEFATAAVLVSFGAVVGKLNPLQLIFMALIEVVVFQCNQLVVFRIFKATDVGASMIVHVFGAYFGLMVAFFTVRPGEIQAQAYKELSVYHSDFFSLIGTIVLWIFWPSWNGALAEGEGQYRAVVNTYLALSASVLIAFAFSALVQKHRRFTMFQIQNATLAGGVAIGSMADLVVLPWGALLVGAVAGALSLLAYKYITPWLTRVLKMHDTRGVHSLHALPGIVAAAGSSVCAALATHATYGDALYKIFPALEMGRSVGEQAGFQMAALGVTIALALGSGIITGFLLRIPVWTQPVGIEIFDDFDFWVLPSDGYPAFPPAHNPPSIIFKKPDESKLILDPATHN